MTKYYQIILISILSIILINGCIFEPEKYKVDIEQNIGGKLICDVTYTADHHSWTYFIDYKYQDKNDSIYDIGYGSYDGREWKKDEQLIKYDKWIILKTGNYHGSDKVFITSSLISKWDEYIFSPETIEHDSIWISKNIHSLLRWSPSESYILSIENGYINVIYEYRTDEKKVNKTEKKLIMYSIDKESGIPRIKEII
ncbi:hypothetical protein ACFLTE_11355 [Bacteroidota bacterium]